MRTTKLLSVSRSPKQSNETARGAKRANRTVSELVCELYRRHVADAERQDFGRTLDRLREAAAGTQVAKITMSEIDAEIRAARRARKHRAKPTR